MAKWEALESTEERDQEVVNGHDLLFDGHFIGFIVGDIVSRPNIGQEIARKLNAFDEMLEALKAVEWVEFSDSDHGVIMFCSVCRNDKKYGHYEGCQIDAAITKAEGK